MRRINQDKSQVNSKLLVRDRVCTPVGAALNKIIFVVPEAQKKIDGLRNADRYVKAN